MAIREIVAGVPVRLVGLLVLAHVAFTGCRFTLMLFAVSLKASEIEIGLLMGLIMVFPMLFAVRAGQWCDQYGYVRPTALALILLISAGGVAGFIPHMSGLYMASILVGSGFMLTMIAVNNAIGQATTSTRLTQSFSVMTMGFSLSGILGPVIAGFMIDHFGHASAFLILTLFALAALVQLTVARRHHLDSPQEPRPNVTNVIDLVWREPMRSVFIVSAVISMAWDLFMFLAPLHGARIGLSATAISMIVGAYGVGTFMIRGLLPTITASLSIWRMTSICLFVTGACYLIFPLATTLFFLLPAAMAMGLALGCGQPMALSLVHQTAPPSRSGEAAGVRSTITSASQTFLPLVFGALGSAVGVLAVFWIGALFLIAGGVFARQRE